MIFITSFGEFLLYFTVIFYLFSFHKKKRKKNSAAGSFVLFSGFPAFAAGIHFHWIKNSKASRSGAMVKLIVIK